MSHAGRVASCSATMRGPASLLEVPPVSPISLARPPQHPRQLQTWTLESFADLTHLRADLTAVLKRGGEMTSAPDQVTEGMVLVVSELATNALKHAGTSTTVTLTGDDESYLLVVADHSPSAAPAVASGRAPGEGGFGLMLAERIARRVGWYITGSTKHVWALFPVREAAADPSSQRLA